MRLLQEWVTRQAERRPDATAVVMGAERLTYGQLEMRSTRLARLLRSRGLRKGDRVCLVQPKSVSAVVSMLGVLKADCVYVPIEDTSPAARVAKIVEASEPRCLLGGGTSPRLVDELVSDPRFRESMSFGWMGDERVKGQHCEAEFALPDIEEQAADPLAYENTPADAAHILFTSGSTGVPKGVVITHANVTHFVNWATGYFGASESDRNSGQTPFHFDLSTYDIFGTFKTGAELHLVPPSVGLMPPKIAELMRESRLTQWFSVPSILNYMAKFDVVKSNDFPDLKRLLWCGEVLPTPTLIYWMERLPHVTFTNLYGPTEATIASSYYTVPATPEDARAPIPIGMPCTGEKLPILDKQLWPVKPGDTGDLYIQGPGLSPGYWRDEEKTRAAFLPHPTEPNERLYRTGDLARLGDDELIYFLGREDTQIKSRGYRIELGEVESALSVLPGLKESAAVAVETGGFEGNIICCAYAPFEDAEVNPTRLRRQLAAILPTYMIPSKWQAMDALPKNPNGKIDRPKVKELFRRHVAQTG